MKSNAMPELSKREKQVVHLVCQFKKREAIASELEISVSTVDVYLLRIRRKFGLSGMLQIAVYFSLEIAANHSRE
jgi:DNA-binding CsgD family transcriptional regulator